VKEQHVSVNQKQLNYHVKKQKRKGAVKMYYGKKDKTGMKSNAADANMKKAAMQLMEKLENIDMDAVKGISISLMMKGADVAPSKEYEEYDEQMETAEVKDADDKEDKEDKEEDREDKEEDRESKKDKLEKLKRYMANGMSMEEAYQKCMEKKEVAEAINE